MEGQFATPPLCTNEDGAERRVGVEVEFGGLDGLPAARLVADLLGGRIVEKDPYDFRVKDTSLGEFTVKARHPLRPSSQHFDQCPRRA